MLGTEVIYRDPAVEQWGLNNFLGAYNLTQELQPLMSYSVPLGGDIIEVVAPFRSDTTAGRLLEKRGDGGYMIIMQTEDARKRREYIEAKGLSKVIFDHEYSDSVCVQYHPRGIKGMSQHHLFAEQVLTVDHVHRWHVAGT